MQPLLTAISMALGQDQRQMWEMPVPLPLAPRCHRPCAILAYTCSHFMPKNLSEGRLEG